MMFSHLDFGLYQNLYWSICKNEMKKKKLMLKKLNKQNHFATKFCTEPSTQRVRVREGEKE